eukprot:3670259-Alexandrium_andersonii.AAC.1
MPVLGAGVPVVVVLASVSRRCSRWWVDGWPGVRARRVIQDSDNRPCCCPMQQQGRLSES